MATFDPKAPPKMPSAVDLARIPEAVRAHALVMHRLGVVAREARKHWTALREQYKVWQQGNLVEPREPVRSFELRPVMLATMKMWDAELAQEQAAAVYRAQLDENDARPVSERWSPTVLGIWVRCMLAAETPA